MSTGTFETHLSRHRTIATSTWAKCHLSAHGELGNDMEIWMIMVV